MDGIVKEWGFVFWSLYNWDILVMEFFLIDIGN